MNKDVNIILVDGEAGSGKTTFASGFANQDKTSYWLSLDRMSFDFVKLHNIKIMFHNIAKFGHRIPNISGFYTSKHFDLDKLINELLRYLEFGHVGLVDVGNPCSNEAVPTTSCRSIFEKSNDSVCVVSPEHPRSGLQKLSDVFTSSIVIEGFFIAYLKKIGRELKPILKGNGYKNIFSISLKSGGHDSRQHSAVIGEDHYDISSKNYSEVFERLRSDIKSKCIKNVFNNKSEYQSFGNLTTKGSDSDSHKKYSLSGMDAIISKFTHAPSVLDVGCNKGFFCHKFSERTSGSILGIDINPESIKDANSLNFSIFKNPNIKFENVDFFNFKCHKKYDIVFCASTFHYFRNNQFEFINKVWSDIIAEGGVFVLEAELYPNNDKPERKPRSRPVDKTPCLFPNEKYLENMITGKFSIEATNKSCFQKGSYYDRYFFVMRKLNYEK